MKTKIKKQISILLVFALACSALYLQPSKAAAANNEVIVQDYGTAAAGEVVTKTFSLKDGLTSGIFIYIPERINFKYEFTNLTNNTILTSQTVSADDDSVWETNPSTGYPFFYLVFQAPASADYAVSFAFEKDTQYAIMVVQQMPDFYIDYSSIYLTKGFSFTLHAVKSTESVKWSSSNKKVATVKNGVVKGVSTGTAVITAVDSYGTSSVCTVKVLKNEYKTSKNKLSDYDYGKAYIHPYNASYKNGSLVVKANILNKTSNKISKLKNIKLTVKTANGKVIGKKTIKSKNISIASFGTKTITITIPKKSLKLKKTQDIRRALINLTGSYI